MADSTRDKDKGGAMRIDPALVRELAQMLADNGLTEIEVEDGERRIKVAREPAQMIGMAPAAAAAPMMAAPAPAVSAASAQANEIAEGEPVKCPMVGTVYLSAEPGSKPFISVGDTVKPGDTLMIVEAMKVMNPITAPSGGTVKKLLVADAQPVEFDQVLVVLG